MEAEPCPHCGAPGLLERVWWSDQHSAGHVVHACDPYDLAKRELTALISDAEDAVEAEPCVICGYGREMTHHLNVNAKGYHPFQLDQPYASQFDGPSPEQSA
jgi:hypothetical protein